MLPSPGGHAARPEARRMIPTGHNVVVCGSGHNGKWIALQRRGEQSARRL